MRSLKPFKSNHQLLIQSGKQQAVYQGNSFREYWATIVFLCLGACGYFQLLPNGWLALAMVACIAQRIYFRIDHSLIILELTGLIAILQCVIGPALMYESQYTHYKYMMYVDAVTYFSFAIPGICMFVAALCLPISANANLALQIRNSKKMDQLGWLLLIIAFFGTIGSQAGLGFFGYLCAQFKYIAAICLFMSNNRYRWVVLIAVLTSGYVHAARHGMFHEIIIWSSFLASFGFIHRKRSHFFKISLFAFSIVALFTIQGVKAQYREALAEHRNPNLAESFFNVLWSLESVYADHDFRHISLTRLNQGWIISRVMQYVPRYEPYAEGETISTAIYASIVPRVLDKEKSTAGGRTNFRRFAGLNISDTTSMCIGILGEAYANYGVNGGILMMLVLGCFLNKALAWFINLGKFNGYFLLCLPLIFLQVVKSETELVVVLNHLSKACLVVWLFYFILPRAFGSTKRTAHPQLKSRTMTGRSHAKPTPLAVGAKL